MRALYDILGVPPSASAEEIKAAYRDLVKRWHPDKFALGTEKAHANRKMQEINQAFAILGDHQRRERYDRSPTPVWPARASANARYPTARRTKKRHRYRMFSLVLWLLPAAFGAGIVLIAFHIYFPGTLLDVFRETRWQRQKRIVRCVEENIGCVGLPLNELKDYLERRKLEKLKSQSTVNKTMEFSVRSVQSQTGDKTR